MMVSPFSPRSHFRKVLKDDHRIFQLVHLFVFFRFKKRSVEFYIVNSDESFV